MCLFAFVCVSMCGVSYRSLSVFLSYYLFGFLGIEPHLFVSVSLSNYYLPVSPSHHSICLFACLCLLHSHTHKHKHTHIIHTSVSLLVFSQLFRPKLLHLHPLSQSKVTTFVFMSCPPCAWVCVCEGVTHTVTRSLSLSVFTHSPMPSGPCTQLSVSLILFSSSTLNPSSLFFLIFLPPSISPAILPHSGLLPSLFSLQMMFIAGEHRRDGF